MQIVVLLFGFELIEKNTINLFIMNNFCIMVKKAFPNFLI